MTSGGGGAKRRPPRPPRRGPRKSRPQEQEQSSSRGFMRRLFGGARREEIREQRYKPYSFESNSKTLIYLGIGLGVWVLLALLLAVTDRANAGTYREWQEQGRTAIPPSGVEPEALLEYAEKEGIGCTTLEDLQAITPACAEVYETRREFVDSQSTSNLLFAGLILVTVFVIFPFTTLTHRASRNLLALKSAGQKHTPEWAVLWLFIPVMNVVRSIQVFHEMFKGSDPQVTTENDTAWKEQGRANPIVFAWWLLFVVALVFNPVFVPRVWSGTRQDLGDVAATSNMLFWSDLLLAIMGVLAFAMMWQLHRLQEARHAKVGDIVVTRPLPRNPFADQLSKSDDSSDDKNKGDNS